MTILPAQHHVHGIQHFYVHSDSGQHYTVTHIRRRGEHRWQCTCPDYTFRRLAQRRHCKHLRQLVEMVKLAGGIRKLLALAQPEGA